MVHRRDAPCLPDAQPGSEGEAAHPSIPRPLPDTFETSDAKDIAEEDEIPESTMHNWFNRLQESGDLEKIKHGLYRKT